MNNGGFILVMLNALLLCSWGLAGEIPPTVTTSSADSQQIMNSIPARPEVVLGDGRYPKQGELAVRKVVRPRERDLYLSAKKLEQSGDESIDEAMSIYRMAIHNGAVGRNLEQAYLGLARCEYRKGDYWAAFLAIEASYPAEFEQAELELRAQMEMDLADRLALKRNEMIPNTKLDNNGNPLSGYQAAARIYEAIVYNDRNSVYARQALRKRGWCLREAEDYEAAERAYYLLVNSFPMSKEANLAKPELVELLAVKSKLSGGIKGHEQDRVEEFIRQVKGTRTVPDPEYQVSINRAVAAVADNQAERRLKDAKFYLARGGKKANSSAKFILEDIVNRFPETKSAEEARKLLGK